MSNIAKRSAFHLTELVKIYNYRACHAFQFGTFVLSKKQYFKLVFPFITQLMPHLSDHSEVAQTRASKLAYTL